MNRDRVLRLLLLALLLLAVTAFRPPTAAAQDSHTFSQTGKTVSGRFWEYWQQNGGLAQQGYPISDEMQERSDLDGKTYTVQYFERAVFELHPENQPPYDVLLSQLGKFQYRDKYQQPTPVPAATATAAPADPCGSDIPAPNNATISPRCGPEGTVYNVHLSGFAGGETIDFKLIGPSGHALLIFPNDVGTTNGSGDLDVQFDSSQLRDASPPHEGIWTITYSGESSQRQATASFKVTPPANGSGGGSGASDPCAGIPDSINQTVLPKCGPQGATFAFAGSGFQPGEMVGIYATMPDGQVFGAPFQEQANSEGNVIGVTLTTHSNSQLGIWADTMEGTTTHARSIGYFKVIPAH